MWPPETATTGHCRENRHHVRKTCQTMAIAQRSHFLCTPHLRLSSGIPNYNSSTGRMSMCLFRGISLTRKRILQILSLIKASLHYSARASLSRPTKISKFHYRKVQDGFRDFVAYKARRQKPPRQPPAHSAMNIVSGQSTTRSVNNT